MDRPKWMPTRWATEDRRFEIWNNSARQFTVWKRGDCLGTFRDLSGARRCVREFLRVVPVGRKSA